MPKYRKTPWISPRVEIRSSVVHGKGLFARERIAQGETVAIWGGNFVSKEEAERMKNSDICVQQIDEDVFEVFSYERRGEDPTYFQNHSCDSNTWMKDEVTVISRRKIEPGEELTIDYALFEIDEDRTIIEACLCGSPKCRTRITGKDWRLREIQNRYRNRFSPLINRRIIGQSNETELD